MAKIFCMDCGQAIGKIGILDAFSEPKLEGIEFKDGWRCKECAKRKKENRGE